MAIDIEARAMAARALKGSGTASGMGSPNYSKAVKVTTLPYTATEECLVVGSVYSNGGGYALSINSTITLTEQGWSNLSFILNTGDVLASNIELDEIEISAVPITIASVEGLIPGVTSYNDLTDLPLVGGVTIEGTNLTLEDLGLDLSNFYEKFETYTQEEILALIAKVKTFSFKVVEGTELPTSDIADNYIYLLKVDSEDEDDIYEEWAYIDSKWERLGSTKINLDDYATKAELKELEEDIEIAIDGINEALDFEALARTQADIKLQDQIDDLVEEAPADDKSYLRKNEAWVEYEESSSISNGVKYNLTSLVDGNTTEYPIAEDILSEHAIGLFLNGLYLVEGIDYSIDYDNHILTTKNTFEAEEAIAFIMVVGGLTGVPVSGYGIEEAPVDGKKYSRRDKEWVAAEQYITNPFAFDGTILTFDVSNLDISNSSKIFINGIRLIYSIDYKIQNNTIEFETSWTQEDSCLIEL